MAEIPKQPQTPSPIAPELLAGLASMIGDSPIGYALLAQPAQRFAYFNESLARIVGIPAAEAIGKTPEEVFGPQLTGRLTPPVLAALAGPGGRGQVEIDAELPGRPGEIRVFRLYCHRVISESDAHTGTWYVVQEVTNERRLEAETRDNSAHLQAVLDVVPAGVLIADAGGQLIYANREAERLWGHALIRADGVEEYVRYELYHPDGTRVKPEESTLAQTLATRAPLLKSRRLLKRPDESWASVLSNSVPLLDDGGDLTGAVVAFWDVTELEQLQRRQERLMEIAQAVNADADLRDVLRMVRDAVVQTAGFDRAGLWLYDEVAGGMKGTWGTSRDGQAVDEWTEFFTITAGDDHPLRQILAGDIGYFLVHQYEFALRPSDRVDMRGVGYHATLGLALKDTVIGLLCVDNLLTNRPISEDDLRALLPFCEQAAIAIESARLRQAERRQTAWWKEAVRVTNHRVKNNLQVILAMVETELLSETVPIDRQTLERIKRQIRVIGGVHDFLGDAAPELEAPLRGIVENIMPMFETSSEIRYELSCTEMVVTTKQATTVALILNELIANASHRIACHASRVSRVSRVSVSIASANDLICLEVSDDGPGFPPGFRMDADTHRGLGLVERLARWDLRGTVAFSNAPAGGARITIEFPCRA